MTYARFLIYARYGKAKYLENNNLSLLSLAIVHVLHHPRQVLDFIVFHFWLNAAERLACGDESSRIIYLLMLPRKVHRLLHPLRDSSAIRLDAVPSRGKVKRGNEIKRLRSDSDDHQQTARAK